MAELTLDGNYRKLLDVSIEEFYCLKHILVHFNTQLHIFMYFF